METNNKNNKKKKDNKPFSFNWFYGILIIFAILLVSQEFLNSGKDVKIDSAKFFSYLEKGYVTGSNEES